MMIEALLEKPYWLIDFLPEQVPQDRAGQFFAVERYYLSEPRQTDLRHRFAEILLKVNCYYGMQVGTPEEDTWKTDPEPETLISRIERNGEDLCVLLPEEKALFVLNRDDTHMTVFQPSEKLLGILSRLAAGEGLYLWQPPQ